MATTGDVHVGDIGTEYRAKIQDNGAAFDPTLATTLKLIFKNPNGVIERDASVEQVGGEWYLVYTVTSADGAAFHPSKGTYSWQGKLVFAGGETYHTNIETYTVAKNLD